MKFKLHTVAIIELTEKEVADLVLEIKKLVKDAEFDSTPTVDKFFDTLVMNTF